MRPVLLRSAGIVGLAGAIMAVVSGNALFVDLGGPDRPSLRPTIVDGPASAPVVIAASSGVAEPANDAIAALLPQFSEQETLPPREAQPETTASVIPAERTPPAKVPPVSPVAVSAAADAVEPPPSIEAAASKEEETTGEVSALWPKDSVECPVDWVAVTGSGDQQGASDNCRTIASLVQAVAGDPTTLRKALPEEMLDLVALAPTIPIPNASAAPESAEDASAPSEAEQQAVAEPEAAKSDPAPKPTPVRASRRAGWPAEPPPDCGSGKHAYWHFVQGHHGAKEWYCR